MWFKKYHLPIVFFAILFLPVLNSSIGIWEYERSDENRTFKDSLEVDYRHLDKFPSEAEEYINDNFSFRRPLLDVFHHLKFRYFNVSPHPDQTVVGKNGWYFLAGEEVEIYGGKHNFSANILEAYKKEWHIRKNYFDSKGIKHYWIIAPFKLRVYGDQGPENLYEGRINRIDELKAYLEPTLPDLIIDPVPTLKKHKKSKKLFFQLDNHWNSWSCYLTTKLLMERIRADFPNHEGLEIPSFVLMDSTIRSGIHRKVLGLDDLFEIVQWPIFINDAKEIKKYGFEVPDYFPYPKEYEMRYENKNSKSTLRILVIRDSFAADLIPFISNTFRESTFIFDAWHYNLNREIIETVKPDIVVYLGVETHMDNILRYNTY